MDNQTYDPTSKGLFERVLHALSFECLATLICAPLFAFLMNKPILTMGALTLMFASIAMIWNMIYNFLFDQVNKRWSFEKTFKVRLVHGILFEGGLIFVLVPIAAWWLSVSLWVAFLMEIGMILFFLPYTVIFNWIYDHLRKHLWMHRHGMEHKQQLR